MNINEKLENCLITLKDKTKEVENLKKTVRTFLYDYIIYNY